MAATTLTSSGSIHRFHGAADLRSARRSAKGSGCSASASFPTLGLRALKTEARVRKALYRELLQALDVPEAAELVNRIIDVLKRSEM